MHGKKREEYKARFRNPKVAAALAHKAQQWHKLCGELGQRRKLQAGAACAPIGSGVNPGTPAASATMTATTTTTTTTTATTTQDLLATLKLIEKTLLVNPDPSHLWNHRREATLQLSKATMALSDELKLTQAALQNVNPKAYAAWFHRKWTIQQQFDTCALPNSSSVQHRFAMEQPFDQVLRDEISLTSHFLSLDERNFHCWNYRRFLVSMTGMLILAAHQQPALGESGADQWQMSGCDGEWAFLKVLTSSLSPSTAVSSTDADIHLNTHLAGVQIGRSNAGASTNSNSATVPTMSQDATERRPSAEAEAEVGIAAVDQLWELVESEWQFAVHKIEKNFSNGSAFFYRSQLLPFIVRRRLQIDPDALIGSVEEELAVIEGAVFVEPDDQTAWWYHAFLLEWIPDLSVFHDRLLGQAESLRDLLSDSPDNKWVLLGLHRVLDALLTGEEERREILQKLQEIDPDRAARYRNMQAQA